MGCDTAVMTYPTRDEKWARAALRSCIRRCMQQAADGLESEAADLESEAAELERLAAELRRNVR